VTKHRGGGSSATTHSAYCSTKHKTLVLRGWDIAGAGHRALHPAGFVLSAWWTIRAAGGV